METEYKLNKSREGSDGSKRVEGAGGVTEMLRLGTRGSLTPKLKSA